MNTQEEKLIAKKLGVKSANMDKGELIRAIQAAEGNRPAMWSQMSARPLFFCIVAL